MGVEEAKEYDEEKAHAYKRTEEWVTEGERDKSGHDIGRSGHLSATSSMPSLS